MGAIELDILWEHCTIGFNCPDCGKLLVARSAIKEWGQSRDERAQRCECGFVYMLEVELMIKTNRICVACGSTVQRSIATEECPYCHAEGLPNGRLSFHKVDRKGRQL